MRSIQTPIGIFLMGVVVLAACTGARDDKPASGTLGGESSGTAPKPCGNLDEPCAASEYCLISSIPKMDGPDLIMTSDCHTLPPDCRADASMSNFCTCLTEDAKRQNINCSKIGVTYACSVHGWDGITSESVELSCNFIP